MGRRMAGTTGCDVRKDPDAERVVPSFRGDPPFPRVLPHPRPHQRGADPHAHRPCTHRPRSTDPAPRPVPFDLRDGPLADALAAVEQALSDVETAKANVTAERHEFARTFRDQLVAHGDDPSVARDLQATIAQLYWDCSALRVTDLAAATGLGNAASAPSPARESSTPRAPRAGRPRRCCRRAGATGPGAVPRLSPAGGRPVRRRGVAPARASDAVRGLAAAGLARVAVR